MDTLPALAGPLGSLVVAALRAVWSEIDERITADREYRRAHPCETATYHRVMARTLPRWRIFGRLGHRILARRWSAWCTATEREACVRNADTATRLVRDQLAKRRKKKPAPR